VQKDSANNWEHMLTDGLGSVRGVVDTNANVLWSVNLDGYGNPFSTVGTAQTNYGFTGEYGLPGGLLHLRARNYQPGLGVFTALDPFEGMMGRAMLLNGYGWVEGNVASAVDPTGNWRESPEKWDFCKSDNLQTTLNPIAIPFDIASEIKRASVVILVGKDSETCKPEHDSFSLSLNCEAEAVSMGTITNTGIITHDHFSGLVSNQTASLQGSLRALLTIDWIAIRGFRNTWYLRSQNILSGIASMSDDFRVVHLRSRDIGILEFQTLMRPGVSTVSRIGDPITQFHLGSPINIGYIIYGVHIPGDNFTCQNWSCIEMSGGIYEREYTYDVAGDGRVRVNAFTSLWNPGLYASGESGSGVFSSNGAFIGVVGSGSGESELGFAVVDRLVVVT
jgi:RHS repeat-associated protein